MSAFILIMTETKVNLSLLTTWILCMYPGIVTINVPATPSIILNFTYPFVEEEALRQYQILWQLCINSLHTFIMSTATLTLNLITIDTQMRVAIRHFCNEVLSEYADILASTTTKQYFSSLLLGIIMVVPMLRFTKFVLHRTNFLDALYIRLGWVATWLDNATYQWMLRHPTQRNKHYKWKSKNRNNTYKCRRPSYKYKRVYPVRETMAPSSRSDFSDEIIEAHVALSANQFTQKGKFKFQPNTSDVEVGIDTQASYCISNQKKMMKNLRRCKLRIKGIGGIIIACSLRGDWHLPITDDSGVTTTHIIADTILCEEAEKSLLSPQHFYQQYPEGSQGRKIGRESTGADQTVFTYGPNAEYKATMYISKSTRNVPTLYTTQSLQELKEYVSAHQSEEEVILCHEATTWSMQKSPNVISDDEDSDEESNTNTSGSSSTTDPVIQENMWDVSSEMDPGLILPEYSLEHASLSDQAELLRYHYRMNHLSFRKLKALATLGEIPRRLAKVRTPVCNCCQYGRQTRKPWRTKGAEASLPIATAPGQIVSIDMMESRLPGFFAQLKGKLTNKRYVASIVFFDHFSKLLHVEHITDMTSESTVKACEAFEAKASDMGVPWIRRYHTDNGRFADNLFKKHCRLRKISITYCGVNAHHQNGFAERYIRKLSEGARTSLWHASLRWPKVITLHLWPYAIRQEAEIHNSLPCKGGEGKSPIEIFSSATARPKLSNFHTIFCPVYQLKPELASGNSLPRWNSRSRLGINLGRSPRHAGTVYNVLNPVTGLVSPQFHVSFDDFFETVTKANDNNINVDIWQYLSGIKRGKPKATRDYHTYAQATDPTQVVSSQEAEQPIDNIVEDREFTQPSDLPTGEENEEFTPVISRPRRANAGKGVDRLNVSSFAGKTYEVSALESTFIDDPNHTEEYYSALHSDDYRIQEETRDPIAFLAKTADRDEFHYGDAMKQKDKKEFKSAMLLEFRDHIERGNFRVVKRCTLAAGTKVLSAVWAFKRKRDILTNRIIKWKARLNIHGGQQEQGVNYDQTYSPVAQWISIRTILVLSLLHKWKTKQVDFVLAFPQAPIEYELHMQIPPNVSRKDHCLQVLKNLYGQKQAGRVWNRYLVEGLQNIGFQQSKVDECVFYRGDVLFFVYVDDGCFASPNMSSIDAAIEDLRNPLKAKNDYDIEDRGDMADYLGINFTRLPDGRLKLSQPQLIDQIIHQIQGTQTFKNKEIPAASSKILQRDETQPKCSGRFHYRSVIGKLNYLEKGTRPDISYAAHAAARFSSDPRVTHESALNHLSRYLQATREEGLIFDPNDKSGLEVYADADFVGNYCKATAPFDASTAKSRSGYAIMFCGCPIVWTSKLQTCVALSSCESEYYALSQALREAIFIMDLLKEIRDYGFARDYIPAKVYCKAFEDNSAALEMATVHKMRPRTKHINNIYHHFREHVRDGSITIHAISTTEQFADIFTKPLDAKTFLYLRKKYLHW